jgi:hypothetical protein
MDHERFWLGMGALALTTVVLTQAWSGLPPIPCLLKTLTGLACPGCGSSRALRALLLSGDAQTALRLNPLASLAALASAGYAVYALAVLGLGTKRLRLVWAESDRRWVGGLAGGAVLACWVFLVVDGR